MKSTFFVEYDIEIYFLIRASKTCLIKLRLIFMKPVKKMLTEIVDPSSYTKTLLNNQIIRNGLTFCVCSLDDFLVDNTSIYLF
jgi:hypothetical protein